MFKRRKSSPVTVSSNPVSTSAVTVSSNPVSTSAVTVSSNPVSTSAAKFRRIPCLRSQIPCLRRRLARIPCLSAVTCFVENSFVECLRQFRRIPFYVGGYSFVESRVYVGGYKFRRIPCLRRRLQFRRRIPCLRRRLQFRRIPCLRRRLQFRRIPCLRRRLQFRRIPCLRRRLQFRRIPCLRRRLQFCRVSTRKYMGNNLLMPRSLLQLNGHSSLMIRRTIFHYVRSAMERSKSASIVIGSRTKIGNYGCIMIPRRMRHSVQRV